LIGCIIAATAFLIFFINLELILRVEAHLIVVSCILLGCSSGSVWLVELKSLWFLHSCRRTSKLVFLNFVCRFDNHSASFTLGAFCIHHFKNFRRISVSIKFLLIDCKLFYGLFTYCRSSALIKVEVGNFNSWADNCTFVYLQHCLISFKFFCSISCYLFPFLKLHYSFFFLLVLRRLCLSPHFNYDLLFIYKNFSYYFFFDNFFHYYFLLYNNFLKNLYNFFDFNYFLNFDNLFNFNYFFDDDYRMFIFFFFWILLGKV
jgi:hypothetical protein